jgi:hypothetical protein
MGLTGSDTGRRASEQRMSKPVSGTLILLDLAGAVALLLWGAHMVQSGVQRAFGREFRRILSRRFGGRLQAFAAGLAVTAVLQSSTATALMITSFAAGGFVALVPALAAMLGANVGTTLIVQVLSFDVSALSPLLLLVGVCRSNRPGSNRWSAGLDRRKPRKRSMIAPRTPTANANRIECACLALSVTRRSGSATR